MIRYEVEGADGGRQVVGTHGEWFVWAERHMMLFGDVHLQREVRDGGQEVHVLRHPATLRLRAVPDYVPRAPEAALAEVRRLMMYDPGFHARANHALFLAANGRTSAQHPDVRAQMLDAAAWALYLVDVPLDVVLGGQLEPARPQPFCDVTVNGKPCARLDPHEVADLHYSAQWGG